jgi:hypothetical protein
MNNRAKFHLNDLIIVASGKYRGKQGQIQQIEREWFGTRNLYKVAFFEHNLPVPPFYSYQLRLSVAAKDLVYNPNGKPNDKESKFFYVGDCLVRKSDYRFGKITEKYEVRNKTRYGVKILWNRLVQYFSQHELRRDFKKTSDVLEERYNRDKKYYSELEQKIDKGM